MAFAVSTFGTCLAFEAYPLIAIIVLHSGPTKVSALAAAGRAAGALFAVSLGPWVEFHRKRHVMIAMDLVRFAAVISIPAAFALGWLTFAQLLIVSVIGAAADIAFRAASGAYLKAIVQREALLVANARFESTTWTAIPLGPNTTHSRPVAAIAPTVATEARRVGTAYQPSRRQPIWRRASRPLLRLAQ